MSLRADALNLALRLLVKPVLARAPVPGLARQGLDIAVRIGSPMPPLACVLDDETGGEAGVAMRWVSCGPAAVDKAILYFHGGGYIAGSPATHTPMLAWLAQRAGLRAALPAYRLVPETAFPAQFDDGLNAWEALIAKGYRPGDIILGGDSAGGGLALALLGALCARATPPGAAFALSPWTDLNLSSQSLVDNRASDPLFPAARIGELRDLILQGGAADDPRISPLFGEFDGCPPVFLQVSTSEILRDDSTRMAARLRDFGADVTLDIQPGLPHVWALLHPWLPEAGAAFDRIAAFMRQQVASGPADEN